MPFCYSCRKTKDSSQFHKNRTRFSGFDVRCKPCQKARMVKYEPSRKEYWERYDKENYYKKQARSTLRYAVRLGKVKKLPCEVCGSLKVEGHHTDYSKPLEVSWLCHLHHMQLEASLLPPIPIRAEAVSL